MAQNANPAQKPDDPTAQKNPKKKLFLIVGVVLALAAGGGGWYFTQGKKDEAHVEEAKVVPTKTPIFLALEPFTVNLRSDTNDQYLQMGISLKFFAPELEAKIKLSLPEIRSKILQLVTTKTASELLSAEGKSKLVREIIFLSNPIIGIIEAPAPQVVAHQPAVAHQPVAPADISPEAQQLQVTQTVAVTPVPVKSPVPLNGIVDVLFTSFIIQ